jgi:hypothetical protein
MNLPALTKTPRRPVFPAIVKLLSKNLLFWSGKRTTFFGLSRTSKNFTPDLEWFFLDDLTPEKSQSRLPSGLKKFRRPTGNMPAVHAWAPL